MSDRTDTTGWPEWAVPLINAYGSYQGGITSTAYVPRAVFDYIIGRMQREKLDAMLDAEIGNHG